MITFTIDNQKCEIEKKMTIIEYARELGIKIPTLCHNDKIKPYGGCRICLVEVGRDGSKAPLRLLPACCTFVEDGFVIVSNSDRVLKARKFVIELLLSRCPDSAELKDIGNELGVFDEENDVVKDYLLQRAKPQDETKCILCGLCVRVCAEITERHALSLSARGMKRKVKTPFEKISEKCIGCGSCAYVCPTNTITVEEAS